MNPKEFNWAEDQTVTVVNPTDKPFKFMVHSKEYEVGAGQTVKMPGYIAWLYVYGLASQLSQAEGTFNRWNEEGFRQQYYERIVIGSDAVLQQVVVQPKIEKADEFETEEPETTEVEDPTPKVGRRGRPARSQ